LNSAVLTKDYRPGNINEITHRDQEISTMMRILAPALNGITPENMFIYGKMGSGKTVTTKVLAAQLVRECLERNVRLHTIYIHCQETTTNMSIFRNMAENLSTQTRIVEKTPYSADAMFLRFCKLVNEYNGVIIIILDEMDKMDDPNILNLLARLKDTYCSHNVCIIGITNNVLFQESLEGAVLNK